MPSAANHSSLAPDGNPGYPQESAQSERNQVHALSIAPALGPQFRSIVSFPEHKPDIVVPTYTSVQEGLWR
jgi:hypothetical protein